MLSSFRSLMIRGMIERTSGLVWFSAWGAILVPFAVLAATLNYGGFGPTPSVVVNAAPRPSNHLAGWEPRRHHRRAFG